MGSIERSAQPVGGDLQRLTCWFDSGRLLRPSAALPNTLDLVRALAFLAGADNIEPSGNVDAISSIIGHHEHYAFVLVDAMGVGLVNRMPRGSFLRAHLATELRAVFPSTTAAALTSIATGQWPSQHGIPGWWIYLDELSVSAITLRFVERFGGKSLQELGIGTDVVFCAPSHIGHIKYDPISLLPREIADSVYSIYFTGGTPRAGYGSVSEAVDMIARRVATARRPTFSYLYLPHLDEQCHIYGTDDGRVTALLAVLDGELARLAESLAKKGRTVVSSDHGQANVLAHDQVILAENDPLLQHLVVPPTGERVLPLFHVREGREVDFLRTFSQRFGDGFALITADEAESLELFGPGRLSAVTRRRIGSFMGISARPLAINYRPQGVPYTIHVGEHGGLTPAEMRVPLIVA